MDYLALYKSPGLRFLGYNTRFSLQGSRLSRIIFEYFDHLRLVRQVSLTNKNALRAMLRSGRRQIFSNTPTGFPEVDEDLCLPRFPSVSPWRGLKYRPRPRAMSSALHDPHSLSRADLQPPSKDYNYKSSRPVTGCNPHRSLGRSLEPERERVGDRHEATHKGIRDPGLPVEFEAGPDSPEILGRGLHGFFKRVRGSGDAARA